MSLILRISLVLRLALARDSATITNGIAGSIVALTLTVRVNNPAKSTLGH
jgi:hypothetical protein